MVSKAREDFPDPETPVTTVMALCGTSKSMFLRLWTRAPRTTIFSLADTVIRTLRDSLAFRKTAQSPRHATFASRVDSRDPEGLAETSYYSRSPLRASVAKFLLTGKITGEISTFRSPQARKTLIPWALRTFSPH